MARTIVSKGNGRRSEMLSTAVTIPPGTLLEMTSSGTVQAQSVAYSGAQILAEKMIAVENSLVGAEVGTVWAVSSQIQIYHAQSGDEVYLMLEDGQNISVGDELEPNGTNGTMITNASVNPPMAVALEALDLATSSALDDTLILCRII